jgi:hypothetical protein
MMRRPSRMAVPGLAALTAMTFTVVLTVPIAGALSDEPSVKPGSIEGAWKLVARRGSDNQDYQSLPAGVEMIKYMTGGRYVWTIVKEGRIIAAAGGKYTVDKDKYTESVESILGEGQAPLVGMTFDFSRKVEGNLWLHSGALKVGNNVLKIDEKWERCK